jgi:iron complex outermembrane receptor protein
MAAIALAAWVVFGSDAAFGDDPSIVLAQSETKPAQEAEPQAPAEEETPPAGKPEGGGASEAAPSGVEVMHVIGKGATAVEPEVPSSLTQFDARTIEALGAQNISDLSRVTPNVNIVQPGSTQAVFFVRGIGLSDFSSNAAGAVTIFQDDVAIDPPAIQTGTLFDVESVDIVRGPQGSGPYRNASAGAIRVRSRRPTGNYSAQLRSTIGRYDAKKGKGAFDAMIQEYEGAVEAPIVENILSTRLAFRLREADPYKTNGCGNALPFSERLPRPRRGDTYTENDPRVKMCGEGDAAFLDTSTGFKSNVPEGLPRKVNDEHNWAARGTLRINPRDSDLDFNLSAHGSRLDQDSTLGQAIGTTPLPGSGDAQIPFAGQDRQRYVDLDVKREYEYLCGVLHRTGTGDPDRCANPFVGAQMAKRLASGRPLDLGPYRGDYDRVGKTTRDAWGAYGSGEATFGDTKLFAIGSYDQYERFQDQDTDFSPDRLFELAPQKDEAWQMYHQLGLEGELEAEPIQWETGAYYLQEHLDNDGTIILGNEVPGTTQKVSTHRVYSQNIESFGVWGGFGWDFADDLTLEGGVRYNWEHKKFDYNNSTLVISTVPVLSETHQQETWQTPTGQLILTYHIDADKSAYAKYSRGFKAGHFNALSSQNIGDPPAKEEYNDAWETGIRGAWLNRLLTLQSSFFYYRYTNYQVFLFVDTAFAASPPVLAILNAKRAENYGVEVEGAIQPLLGWAPRVLSGLRLSANFSWLHGEYLDFVTFKSFNAGPIGIAEAPIDYSGKPLQNSPQYKVSGTAEWTFDLGRFGYIIPRYDINWTDDSFFDANEGHGGIDPSNGRPALIDYAIGQKQYFLHNVRLAYRTPTGNVEIAGWIRNVEDQVYKNYAFDASTFTNAVINFPGLPRTMGIDFVVTF